MHMRLFDLNLIEGKLMNRLRLIGTRARAASLAFLVAGVTAACMQTFESAGGENIESVSDVAESSEIEFRAAEDPEA